MSTSPAIDQVRIEYDDGRVRCGSALFTPSLSELRVTFENKGGKSGTLAYDLRSIPFNTACLLYDGENRPTQYLLCNRWGTLFVRYGAVPNGRYPALRVVNRPRRLSLCYAPLAGSSLPSSAFHPNSEIPIYVTLNQDRVTIALTQGGVPTFRTEVPFWKLPVGQTYVPRDEQGHPLPLRLRRPVLATLAKVNRVDVEWLG